MPRRLFIPILATVFVGALVSLGFFSSRTISRRSAILAIDERHGTYGIRLIGPSWVRTVVTKLGGDEKLFYNPSRVSLGPYNQGYDPAHPVGDQDLMALAEHLAAFPDLGTLDLMGSQVSNVGIASLPILPSLKVLRLSGTSVTDGLADILPKFPLLAEIWLENTAVTDSGIADIRRQCPACAVKH
jgi:hypothetical protein